MSILEKHQKLAIIIYFAVIFIAYRRFGIEGFKVNALMLLIPLFSILFYRFLGSFLGMGFMASLAKDSGSGSSNVAIAFFMWIFFLIFSGVVVFGKGVVL